jgi:hypothetical protein
MKCKNNFSFFLKLKLSNFNQSEQLSALVVKGLTDFSAVVLIFSRSYCKFIGFYCFLSDDYNILCFLMLLWLWLIVVELQ